MGHIYMILNKKNSKIYIGATTNIRERLKNHKNKLKNLTHQNRGLNKDSKKYGFNVFDFIVLKEVKNKYLDEEERKYISIFDSMNQGYNNTTGGNKNFNMSEETRKLLSEAFSGKNNNMYGKTHTEEAINKIKEKLPDMAGKNNPFFGKSHTKESIEKNEKK